MPTVRVGAEGALDRCTMLPLAGLRPSFMMERAVPALTAGSQPVLATAVTVTTSVVQPAEGEGSAECPGEGHVPA